jgi:hypothetical protein
MMRASLRSTSPAWERMPCAASAIRLKPFSFYHFFSEDAWELKG